MTVNPLKNWQADSSERIIPPSDPQERINFWIMRGNELLEKQGKHHLHWVWHNGSYSIEPRPTLRITSTGAN